MIAVPPFRGEFGIMIRYHVPAVAAFPAPKLVCIEPGNEALYPDAEHILVERRRDTERKDLYRKDREYVNEAISDLKRRYPGCTVKMPDRNTPWPERRFVPEPYRKQGVAADVVICPRKREVAPQRNWPHWPVLAETLRSSGLKVFCGGAPETSDLRANVGGAAWEYGRPLDATIEAMLSARLVIATDAGLAHLAVLCGRPLLIVGFGEHPAPDTRWKVRMDSYYQAANHMNAPIQLVNGWQYPDRVSERATRLVA